MSDVQKWSALLEPYCVPAVYAYSPVAWQNSPVTQRVHAEKKLWSDRLGPIVAESQPPFHNNLQHFQYVSWLDVCALSERRQQQGRFAKRCSQGRSAPDALQSLRTCESRRALRLVACPPKNHPFWQGLPIVPVAMLHWPNHSLPTLQVDTRKVALPTGLRWLELNQTIKHFGCLVISFIGCPDIASTQCNITYKA